MVALAPNDHGGAGSPPVTEPVNRLLALLDLDQRGDDVFVAATPSPAEGPPRLFGGQVASQSLRAATLTVGPDRYPHSLHAYFIRPGAPGVPLELSVDRTRDGRSFSTRTVSAAQNGEPIFVLTASFHVEESGDDWQESPPTGLKRPDEIDEPSPFGLFRSMMPFDIRPLRTSNTPFPVVHPFWVKTHEPMPDDPFLHACAITFISDMAVVASARAPESTAVPFGGASLDHAVWFHRQARADEWMLFSVDPVTNYGARGLARGAMHTIDGIHAVSIAQEALLRPASTPPVP